MSAKMKTTPSEFSPRSQSELTTDQNLAIDRLYDFDHSLLVAGMGAGKTIIALSAMAEFNAEFRFLVVAPKRVVTEVWATEHLKWEHTRHLKVAVCAGGPDERHAVLERDYQILVINFENLAWLISTYDIAQFEGLLIDEIAKLKNTGGNTFKRLRKYIPKFKWRVGMTGTPVSEDFQGIFGQMLIVDAGASLGTRKHTFLGENFVPIDYDQKQWAIREGKAPEILDKVAPYVHVMPDYRHELPPLTINPIYIDVPPPIMDQYKQLARDSVLGEKVTAVNAAVLTGKLQQAAAGFVYPDDDDESVVQLHGGKWLKAGMLFAEAIEAKQNLMAVYWYKEQKRVLGKYTMELTADGVMDAWNDGHVPLMLVHPKSCGHGLNLQYGGSRQLWLGPIWPNDLWEQTIARLWRRGQTQPVHIDVLISKGTIDEVILARCQGKAEWHELFMAHMETIR